MDGTNRANMKAGLHVLIVLTKTDGVGPSHVIEIHGISSPKNLFGSLKLPFSWSKMTVQEQEVPRSLH